MTAKDEPVSAGELRFDPLDVSDDPTLAERIRRLVGAQPYGVLCTQGGGQPYGSLVAFAFLPDMRAVVFATPMATRKYRLLTECDHVALVIDNRPQYPGELMQIEALTVTGRAREIERGPVYDRRAALLTDRHSYLASFVAAPSCALFQIDVLRYIHVTRFQEVGQWVPPASSSSH